MTPQHRDLVAVSTVTSKGQTTVPSAIRQILGTRHLQWRITDRQVIVEAVSDRPFDSPNEDADDPILGAFLRMIDRDIAANREVRLNLPPAVTRAMAAAQRTAEGMDYDGPLDGADDDLLGS